MEHPGKGICRVLYLQTHPERHDRIEEFGNRPWLRTSKRRPANRHSKTFYTGTQNRLNTEPQSVPEALDRTVR